MKAKTKTVKKVKVVKPKKEVKAVKKPNKADKWKVFSDVLDDEDFPGFEGSEPPRTKEQNNLAVIADNGRNLLFQCSKTGTIFFYESGYFWRVKENLGEKY